MDASDPASDPHGSSGSPESGERSAAYRWVEGFHMRQWVQRAVLPLALLATNGRGLIDLPYLPRWDAIGDARWLLPCTIAGVALIALCAAVRIAAKGVLVRKVTLTTGGAYRWVRHPFYLANLLGGFGVLVLAGPLGAACAAAWICVAYPAFAITVRGEEDGLGQLFPAAWAAYAARVPGLIPRPGRVGPAPAERVRVTWTNLRAEREPPRLMRFLAATPLVLGAASTGTLGWAWIGVGTALLVTSHLLPEIQAPSRRATPE